MGETITIKGADGDFSGYLAKPSSGKGPGVVVIQEIFGVNRWVRSVADMLAAEGYFALAPDLFWRIVPGLQLDPTKENEFKRGLELYGRYDLDKAVVDIQSTLTHLRHLPGATGKAGTIGFCAGGLLAYLSAAHTDTNASASYYGGGTNTKLAEMPRIKCPTVLHLAGVDDFMPKEARDEIIIAAQSNPHVSVYVYDGAHHGFCRDTDATHYHAAACKTAHQRTLDLFKKSLA